MGGFLARAVSRPVAGQPAVTPFQAVNPEKKPEQFRNYEADARPTVREFYRQNHRYQTYEFAEAKRREFLGLNRRKMGVWEAMEFLNTLVDDSDPDTDLSQIEHLLQTAERIRADGHPRWFILTGLIHDLGKISASGASRNGPWSATRSQSAASIRTRSCSPSFSHANPDHENPRVSDAARRL